MKISLSSDFYKDNKLENPPFLVRVFLYIFLNLLENKKLLSNLKNINKLSGGMYEV